LPPLPASWNLSIDLAGVVVVTKILVFDVGIKSREGQQNYDSA
jgi:hypothetical protein